MDPTLRQTLINAYNLGSLPVNEQDEIINRIGSLVFQAILVRSMQEMSEDSQNKFEALLDKDASPEEMISFLRTNTPNFDTIAKEEAEKFHKDSQNIMNQIG